jgi:hypothetical protein
MVLIMVVGAPIAARNEYRRTRGHWPHARPLTWLRLAALEGMCLLGLVIVALLLISTFGNVPLDIIFPRWLPLAIGCWYLFFGGVEGLVALERRCHGEPPRTLPTA